jgi:hypothetical protein
VSSQKHSQDGGVGEMINWRLAKIDFDEQGPEERRAGEERKT